MLTLRNLIKIILYPETYIWVEVLLIKETQKAILIEFDGRKAWLPKAWILRIKRSKATKTTRIKISQYHWAEKF